MKGMGKRGVKEMLALEKRFQMKNKSLMKHH